jgi:hypothetical protein
VTRSGLQFKYVFRDGANMTFLLPELFAPNFSRVLERLRNRHGAVVKIVEASKPSDTVAAVEPAPTVNPPAVEPRFKMGSAA